MNLKDYKIIKSMHHHQEIEQVEEMLGKIYLMFGKKHWRGQLKMSMQDKKYNEIYRKARRKNCTRI